jgi:hypothetical protein
MYASSGQIIEARACDYVCHFRSEEPDLQIEGALFWVPAKSKLVPAFGACFL